jgi:hypothetical protein
MKKYVLLTLLLSFTIHAVPFVYTVREEVLDLSVLPDCISEPRSYVEVPVGAKPGQLPGYFFSQLQENTEPPYEAFMELKNTEIERFMLTMSHMSTKNDVCDRIGILYAARFFHRFCPDSNFYKSLSKHHQNFVASFFHYPGEVFKIAKMVSRCQK